MITIDVFGVTASIMSLPYGYSTIGPQGNNIVGYDYAGLDIKNISKIAEDEFRVEGILSVYPKYSEDSSTQAVYLQVFPTDPFNTTKAFQFVLKYKKDVRAISDVSFVVPFIVE
jgi:hypothetical protein